MDNLAQELTDTITDEHSVICIKVNLKNAVEPSHGDNLDPLFAFRAYLIANKVQIVYATLGLHALGENGRAHFHWHIIVANIPGGTFLSNNSLHRKRWLAKDNNHQQYSFGDGSIRFPSKEDPVWQCLAYPWKEGNDIIHGAFHIIPERYCGFLKKYGTDLYQVALGKRARQDACDERKKNALIQLHDLCKQNADQFADYRQMCVWLDQNYILTLSVEEYPDPRNYKTNCQKIAINLGKLKYSDII